MNFYRLQYSHSSDCQDQTEDCVEFFEEENNDSAIAELNNRTPSGAVNKKLYNIGTEVSLE